MGVIPSGPDGPDGLSLPATLEQPASGSEHLDWRGLASLTPAERLRATWRAMSRAERARYVEQLRRWKKMTASPAYEERLRQIDALVDLQNAARVHPDDAIRISWTAMDKLMPYEVIEVARHLRDPTARPPGRPKGSGYQAVDDAMMPEIERRTRDGAESIRAVCQAIADCGHPGASAASTRDRLVKRYREWRGQQNGENISS
jgi:hypothetical protein